MNPLRLCLVGGSFGPDQSLICEMLGKDEVGSRIDSALNYIARQTLNPQIMGQISIEGMEFFATRLFKEEQVIGTKFIVDLFLRQIPAVGTDR
jgi:hypothetical protein